MYLNLLYNGKKYLFEANNKINIGHLKEISGKILNSNKNFLHIIQNNNKYAFPNNTFLKDLIPKGQERTVFSIKADEKNVTYNEDRLNGNNSKTTNQNRKSFDGIIKSMKIKKNIFNKSSNIWNIQRKFSSTMTYKYNEFLVEIREFNKRVNEIYDKLYQNYIQSNMNSKNISKNDINKKLTIITLFQHQMIKFIENEKNYYQKLNILIKNCISINNSKIKVSNKNLKELYIGMINANMRNSDYNINSNQFFHYFNQKNTMLGNMSAIFRKNNNKFILENLSLEKTFRKKKRKMFPSLSTDNINGNNEIIGSQDEKMIISNELDYDGIHRGKITIFDNGEQKKSSIDSNSRKETDKNSGNKEINKKADLKYRNTKLEDYFSHSITNEEENKNISRNLSERFINKNKTHDFKNGKNLGINLINNNFESNKTNISLNKKENNMMNDKHDNEKNLKKNTNNKKDRENNSEKKENKKEDDESENEIKNKSHIHSLFYKNKNINNNSSEEDSSREENKQIQSKKKGRKKYKIIDDEKESGDSKKDPFDDINLLKGLLTKKYSKRNVLDFEDISDEENAEKKLKIQKRRKEQLMKNKYESII